jgi:hypothetical protein
MRYIKMKNYKKFIAVVIGSMLLAGCSSSASNMDIIDLTDDMVDIKDVTDEYSDVDSVESVKSYEVDGALVEIWKFSSDDGARAWFDEEKEALHENASSTKSLDINGKAKYKFTVDGKNYRLLCNGDTAVYAYGDDSAIVSVFEYIDIDY